MIQTINNFIIDSSLNPDINDSIYYESIITKNSFYNQLFCNTHIILNIINTKPYNSNKIIFKGILYESSPKSLNFNINFNSSLSTVGSMNDANILLDIVNHSDNFDIFFLLRHNERVNKNDLLNFTNLNFNNTIPMEKI